MVQSKLCSISQHSVTFFSFLCRFLCWHSFKDLSSFFKGDDFPFYDHIRVQQMTKKSWCLEHMIQRKEDKINSSCGLAYAACLASSCLFRESFKSVLLMFHQMEQAMIADCAAGHATGRLQSTDQPPVLRLFPEFTGDKVLHA